MSSIDLTDTKTLKFEARHMTKMPIERSQVSTAIFKKKNQKTRMFFKVPRRDRYWMWSLRNRATPAGHISSNPPQPRSQLDGLDSKAILRFRKTQSGCLE